jgi:hypothetical protein
MDPMMTVKQIQRTWSASQHERLYRDLVLQRPEAALELGFNGASYLSAAALAMIRMDELTQSHVPFYGQLVRTLVAAQQPDGGWGDPALSALCLRALSCGNGQGRAIERGMAYLGNLQKDDGAWPRVPLRRMPEDSGVSAFILWHLAGEPAFQDAVRVDDAIDWYERNALAMDEPTRELCRRAARRCRVARGAHGREFALARN